HPEARLDVGLRSGSTPLPEPERLRAAGGREVWQRTPLSRGSRGGAPGRVLRGGEEHAHPRGSDAPVPYGDPEPAEPRGPRGYRHRHHTGELRHHLEHPDQPAADPVRDEADLLAPRCGKSDNSVVYAQPRNLTAETRGTQ